MAQTAPNIPLNLVRITVRSPDKLYYEGDAVAVSSINDKGPFDILPQHINFITIIKNYVIVHEQGGVAKKVPFDTGILHLSGNKIDVYVGIGPKKAKAPPKRFGILAQMQKEEQK